MPNPVYLDGPLEHFDHPVSQDEIESGQIIFREKPGTGMTPETVIYTVTRVGLLGRVVVVASVQGGVPDMALLFARLVSDAAKAAAE